VLAKIIRQCKRVGVIMEDLVNPREESMGDTEQIYRGLCKLPNLPDSRRRRRRINVLVIDWKVKGAALLYYTVRTLSWISGEDGLTFAGREMISFV
jgi:DNA polymerase lambda